MIYTLEDSNAKRVSQPTDKQIQAAVEALDGDITLFLILRVVQTHFIQATWDAKDELICQYEAGDEQHLFETWKKYSVDVVVKVFVSYVKGTDEWKKLVEWKPVK